MSDQICALVTAAGARILVGPRTSAIIGALADRQERIESLVKGSVEVRADFAGGSMTIALKEITEPVRIRAIPSAR